LFCFKTLNPMPRSLSATMTGEPLAPLPCLGLMCVLVKNTMGYSSPFAP